jgi:hypothetical protein
LIRAKERGVDVRVIADKAAPCGRASGIEPLAAAGVPIWIDDRARLAVSVRFDRRQDWCRVSSAEAW